MDEKPTRRPDAPERNGSDPERDALLALVDISADGLALLDADGRFTRLNESAARVLGLPAAELLGRRAPFVPVAGGDAHTVRWAPPGGRKRFLEYHLAPLPGSGHAVWFCDVTGARLQQERLTAIARAASSVAEACSLPVTLDAVAGSAHAAVEQEPDREPPHRPGHGCR